MQHTSVEILEKIDDYSREETIAETVGLIYVVNIWINITMI